MIKKNRQFNLRGRKTCHALWNWFKDLNLRIISLFMFALVLVSCNKESETLPTEEIGQKIPASTTSTPRSKGSGFVKEDQGDGLTTGSDEVETMRLAADNAQAEYAFALQPGSPVAIKSWTHDCGWMGVGGQVFYDGNPVNNLIVETGGTLAGEEVLGLSITGLVSTYGSGGYEIQLADTPIESVGTIWIQLKDITGLPLSPRYAISSYNDCEQNLVLVNFTKSEYTPVIIFYYPIFFR